MSRRGEISLAWGDGEGPGENGEYVFRLGIDEWDRLDERFDLGPYEILRRVSLGTWKRKLVREVIRLGLIAGGSVKAPAGGVDDARVNRLVREYVDNRPLLRGLKTAALILGEALHDPEDDPIPKLQAEEGAAPIFQTEDSPSPVSTDGGQSSDTRSKKSERSRSGSSMPPKSDTSSPTVGRKNSRRQPPMTSTQ